MQLKRIRGLIKGKPTKPQAVRWIASELAQKDVDNHTAKLSPQPHDAVALGFITFRYEPPSSVI